MKVFVMEDSPLLRSRIEELLGGTPNVALVSQVGALPGAVQTILAVRPDVVILGDEPGHGIDILAELQASEIPMIKIMLTTFPNPMFRQRCLDAGADYFLDKTIEFEHLAEIIEGLVMQWSEGHGK